MTQYNLLNLKLCDSQLNNINSGIKKNCSKVT